MTLRMELGEKKTNDNPRNPAYYNLKLLDSGHRFYLTDKDIGWFCLEVPWY